MPPFFTTKRYLAALGLTVLASTGAVQAQTIDGTRDASYPAALAVQVNPTSFGNSTTGQVGVANGDELDNVHARIAGGNLYLFIGGNLQTNNNRLEIFIDSKTGGQNVLAAGGGGPLASLTGLTFDAGFTADYLLSVGANQNGANFNFVYVDYGVVGNPAASGSAGGGSVAGVSQTIDFDVTAGTLAGAVALNNSNTAGVDGSAVNNPGAVSTGVELRIPLSAIGTSVNNGNIRVCVFTNGSNHDFVSNQVLAPLPAGRSNLGGDNNGTYLGGASPVSGVNFATITGNQYVTISTAAPTQVVDGALDPLYSTALAVQSNPTSFGNSTVGQVGVANGDELDNIHAQIVGSNLYLFIGGNLQTNNNRVEIFFDSQTGGQNVLGAGGGGPLASLAGLTFDTGFSADYLVSVGANQNGANFNFVYVDYGVVGNPAASGSAGGGSVAGVSQPIDFNVTAGTLAGEVGLNNSNTAGVDASAVNSPQDVTTGIELRIPLSAIGASVNSGDIRMAIFTNGSNHDYVSNQVLAPLPTGTSSLGGDNSGGYLGGATPVSGVNFTAFGGDQFVTIANGGAQIAPAITVSPLSLNFFNVGVGSFATRTFLVTNGGGGATPLNVTITPPSAAYAVSPSTLSLPAGTNATITVTFTPTTAGPQNGNISLTSNASINPNPVVAVTGTGVAPGIVVVDGVVDAALYGTPKALQTVATQFGNNTASTTGSELDGAYSSVIGTDLFVTLTGNLESGGNKILLFIDANPTTGQNTFLASNPTVDFGNSANLAGLTFDRGFRPESFMTLNQNAGSLYASYVLMNGAGGNGAYLSAGSQAFTQPLNFGGGVFGELSFNNSNIGGVTGSVVGNPGSVTTGIEMRIPLSVLGGSVNSTTPIHMMAVIVNGNYDYLSNQTLGGLPVANNGTNLGANGTGGGSIPFTIDFQNFPGNQFFTAQRGTVTVDDARALAGDYANIMVADGGVATITGPLDVQSDFTVGVGAELITACQPLTGAADFTLQTGATLAICDPNGISSSGATGAIQLSGTRTFSNSALYRYDGTQAQITGTGLPTQVRRLTTTNPQTVSLTQPVSVLEVLTIGGAGNLNLNSQPLTLLSSSNSTAMTVNSGAGAVIGTATVQRYLTAAANGVLGYRHLSSPVRSTTVSDLSTLNFTPFVNPAYNTIPTPVLPIAQFPNVFGYDESRGGTNPATQDFTLGYYSPNALSDVLTPGIGYTAYIRGGTTPDFVGTLATGNVPAVGSLSLSRTSGPSNPGSDKAGWHLLGNPYPSPIDWDNIPSSAFQAGGQFDGLSGAIFVLKSTGPTSGQYLTRVASTGTLTDGLLPMAQGFFTRVVGTGPASFSFSNALRVTSYENPPHYRSAPDARPLLSLNLRSTSTADAISDETFVYFPAGATDALDAAFDAQRPGRNLGDIPTLATLAGQTAELAVNALNPDALAAGVRVPLLLMLPQTGTYKLSLGQLANLDGIAVSLEDALTSTTYDLRQQPSVTLAAQQLNEVQRGRWTLVLGSRVTGLSSLDAAAATLQLWPNPTATGAVRVTGAAKGARLTVLDPTGRVVRSVAGSADATLDLRGLPAGVYVVRSGSMSRRLVVE